MTRTFLIAILALLTFSSLSQHVLPDNFTIGNFLEVYSKDSLRVYFNCTGTIVDKKCASFYRIGKMDTAVVNFAGEIYDFDINDNLCLKASIINNSIEGYVSYYFKNGKISEEGNFRNNKRVGTWKYFYPGGGLEKIYSYDSDEPLVVEAYKKNGKATVISGNGKIHTEFRNYKQCSSFETWGGLANGKKNGKWTFSNINAIVPIASETYQDGVFVKGVSNNYTYTDRPKIHLNKFYPNENLSLIKNMPGCPGETLMNLRYAGRDLNSTFYPKLQEGVNSHSTSLKNQWLIVGIKIDKDNLMQEINIASSINDTRLENRIYTIIHEMKHWEAAIINTKATESNICFSILVDNNKIIIVADYVHQNR